MAPKEKASSGAGTGRSRPGGKTSSTTTSDRAGPGDENVRKRPRVQTRDSGGDEEVCRPDDTTQPWDDDGDDGNTHSNTTAVPNEDENHGGKDGDDEDDEEGRKAIPDELLARLLHSFFARDDTRITADANAATAKYINVFVREAIARTAAERETRFLEVSDLEKIAPQLLLDI